MPAAWDLSDFYDSCECRTSAMSSPRKVRFIYKDGHEEIIGAGELYYAPPGHTFQVLEDTETVEFSPTGSYKLHMEAVAARVAAASSART